MKAVDDPSLLVLGAVEKALYTDREIRLVNAGKKPENAGLFASSTGKAQKAAIERCLIGPPPLLQIVRSEKSGKTEHRFVTITPEGVDFWVSRSPPEVLRRAVSDGSGLPSNRLEGVFQSQLRLLKVRIDRNEEAWRAAVESERQTLADLAEFVTGYIQRLDTTRSQIEKVLREDREQVARIEEQLRARRATAPTPVKPPPTLSPPMPISDTVLEDRRRSAEVLVFAWKETTSPEARAPLERAMQNLSLEPIGRPNEVVTFDGAHHECPEPVFPGDRVKVVRCGWCIHDPEGEYLLTKATVAPCLED